MTTFWCRKVTQRHLIHPTLSHHRGIFLIALNWTQGFWAKAASGRGEVLTLIYLWHNSSMLWFLFPSHQFKSSTYSRSRLSCISNLSSEEKDICSRECLSVWANLPLWSIIVAQTHYRFVGTAFSDEGKGKKKTTTQNQKYDLFRACRWWSKEKKTTYSV